MKQVAAVLLFSLVSLRALAQGVHLPMGDTTFKTTTVRNQHVKTFPQPANTINVLAPVPFDFYTQHLPFFCRQELKMKDAHVPVSFRLGTVEQCDYLEKK